MPCVLWPGVRRAGLPRQSPALTPGQRIFTKLAKPEKMAWMFDYRIAWDAPVAPALQTARASG